MEIPAWIFFTFFAITGVVFLKLGFIALDKTDISTSVSRPIISLFKHLLAISIFHSSNYALIFRSLIPIPIHKYFFMVMLAYIVILFHRTGDDNPFTSFHSLVYYLIHLFVLYSHPILNFFFENYYAYAVTSFLIPLAHDSFGWYLAICVWIHLPGLVQRPLRTSLFSTKFIISIFFNIESSLFLAGGKTKLFPVFVLLVSLTTSAFWAGITADKTHLQLPSILSGNNRKARFLRFGVGLAGTMVFQTFFGLTSIDQVVAFLCFAVAWLAVVVMLRAPFDFGIFEFLLGNVIVGCAVSRVGLHETTWLFYGASVMLYGLRLNLESVSLIRREIEYAVV